MKNINIIEGNSGAKIELIHNKNNCYVRKTVVGIDSGRLVAQIEKQKRFSNTNNIRTPIVINQSLFENYCSIDMEYISGLDFVTFTNNTDYVTYNKVINILSSYLIENIKKSSMCKFPSDTWNKKCISTINKCNNLNIDLNFIKNFLLNNLPKNILLGPCHGDFTFSNLVIEDNGGICFLDFLNPPIETPYEDVAKILFDANFFWTLNKFNGKCDINRVKIMWKHASNVIYRSVIDYIDNELLIKFQVLSILRICPYTKNKDTINFLERSIQACMSKQH